MPTSTAAGRSHEASVKVGSSEGHVVYDAVTIVLDVVDGRATIGLRLLGREVTVPIEDFELVRRAL